jgi:cold shock CspA family protein
MPTGTIARLLIDKGFGFIRDEGGIEHFFHRSRSGAAVFECFGRQRVEFTPEERKGPRAGDVRLVETIVSPRCAAIPGLERIARPGASSVQSGLPVRTGSARLRYGRCPRGPWLMAPRRNPRAALRLLVEAALHRASWKNHPDRCHRE